MNERIINGVVVYFCDGLWFIEHEKKDGFYVYQSLEEAKTAAQNKEETR